MFADVNECAEDTDNCAQICTDTDGSYVCSCASGYLLTNDSHACDGMQHLSISYTAPLATVSKFTPVLVISAIELA